MILQIPFSEIHAILEGFSGAICLLLGVVGLTAISSQFSKQVSRSFFLLTLSVAVWLFGFALGAVSNTAPESYFWELKVGYFGVVAISPSVLLFVLTFLKTHLKYKKFIFINYLIAYAFYSLIHFDIRFADPAMEFLFYGWYPKFQPHYFLFLAYFSINLGISLFLLLRAYLKNQNSEEKEKILYILAAFFLSDFAALDIIPGLGYKTIYPFGDIPILANNIILFIALIKYRFMDFESEIKRKENRLHLLANYDLTTQLPNRSLFEDRLDQALALAENYNTGVAVFLLDIDRFKRINETFGHRAGDLLLSGVARRLTSCQREGATLSRFEGDMFAIMMPNIHRVENAAVMAETVLSVISDPFIINGKEIFITSSIGISFFPWDQKNANPLLKCADIALQLAQQEGNNKYKFFTSDMHKKVDANLALESQLRHALKKNEFVVHYQPQFDLQTGKLVGAEALLRWHSLGGNIPPTEFIPIAEETGIILPLGDWVLKTVCEQIKAWQKMGFRSPVVAVNVSGKQLQRPNLVAHFTGIIEECGINPAFLCLELTESSLVTDIENTIQTFKKFREMGIQISIDDFGTGYSSLSYLMRFPISTLKIDKSFIKNITLDSNNSAISSAVISMAHSLRLKVVAEGVETEEQVDHLRDKGCDAAQGFYYSPAIPADQFLEILREAEASFPA